MQNEFDSMRRLSFIIWLGLIGLAVALFGCGCKTREVVTRYGDRYKSVHVLTKESFGGLSITNTNGVGMNLDGYQSDQVQAAALLMKLLQTAK